MAGADAAFTGSVPVTYDRYLVPFIFEPFAEDLASRLSGMRDGAILEIAAGTGVVTFALRQRLPPTVSIVATDLNPAMLEIAKQRLPGADVTFQAADAQALPFEDGSFDVVVCQFGVMFFPDPAGALREMTRVLRPGGRLFFNVWGTLDDNPAAKSVSDAVAAAFPDQPPLFLARTPYGKSDPAHWSDLTRRAGCADVMVESVSKKGRAPDARSIVLGLCTGTPLKAEIDAHGAGALDRACAAAEAALVTRVGTGPVESPLRADLISGRKA